MTTAPIRSDWVGRTIDRTFPLLQWLGGSEQSDVFLTDLPGAPGQRAALKLIPAGAAGAQEKIAAWATAKTLSHPHLLRVLDSGRCDVDGTAFLYVVTEYAEENLAEILPVRPLTGEETGEMLGPILDALAYLHAKALVHGHLKPSNLLVVGDQLKLSSDGVSWADVNSAAADMWALGITLVEALTQHRPVWEMAMASGPIVPVSVPQPFFDIAKGCLRAKPGRRWTIEEVRARLAGAKVEEESPAEIAAGKVTAQSNRKFGMALAAGAAILVVSVGLVLRVLGVGQLDSSSHKAGGGGGQLEDRPAHSLPKPSPIKGRAAEAEKAEPLEQAEKPEQPEQRDRGSSSVSPGSSDDSAVLQRSLPEVLPAAQASIHGEFDVEIRVTVGTDGAVSNAAYQSAGPSRYFSKQALEASKHWRFRPAKMSGENVQSVWLLEYHFTQSGVEITPTQISP